MRRVRLIPGHVKEVLQNLLDLQPPNRLVDQGANKLLERILSITGSAVEDDGVKLDIPKDPIEFEVDEIQALAVKVALLQRCAGHKGSAPASIGFRRYDAPAIAKAFGILASFAKSLEEVLPEAKEKGAPIEFDPE